MERGGVFLSRRLVSFVGAVASGNTLFWENLGKTLRPARRVASRAASPLSCVGFMNEPPAAQGTCKIPIDLLAVFCITGFT